MKIKKFRNILEAVTITVFFSAFVLSLLTPITEPDVFWHLKTGEWIWQNRSLPEKDPFTFTVEPYQYEASVRTAFILKQYWLAQLVMYGFYSLGGFYGIEAFRCLVYLGIGLVLYRWMRKNRISRLASLIFLIPVAWFSAFWVGERPNIISFLLTVIVVYLLEDMKEACSKEQNTFHQLNAKRYILLPVVMILWANIHGGFILGDAIIVLYMIAKGLKRIRSVKNTNTIAGTPGINIPFFVICLISVFASFINPNTYKGISIIFEILRGSYFTIPITEFKSPFYYASGGIYHYLAFIVIILVLFLLKVKKFTLESLLLIVALAVLSLKSIRFIPYLVFVSIPFIAVAWKDIAGNILKRVEKAYIPVLVILILSLYLIPRNLNNSILKTGLITDFYPKEAVKFIKEQRPEGEIFNDFTYGGYLIWTLYPDYRVFIDGRGLFQSMHLSYLKASSGSVEAINNIPVWKAILNTYRINTVITPCINVVEGGFVRLIRRLVEDDEWSLVFVDRNALLFVRNTAKNQEIIRRYSMPKIISYEMALRQADVFRKRFPRYWLSYATLGEINLYLGRPRVALSNFELALRLNPQLKASILNRLLEEIRAGRDYSNLLDQTF